ncbi:UDP-N-acetylenolpyruvoylglucosamine reductase [Candidatus Epulonipiscium fishelsonii]|uniref:UDP-N-acetylenolpyruvoylglucosamine reductase n=1 Tax=Candidatus Epulonipiscium fishelsonii TaxID=77094 RepID=A0ACC8XF73_9FIRM|nr:UDP-N-acetylenolpyruvoylglucosamine reductase [Epulopiscium sp. SCG-B05WGA-EpuloA1]ONI41894.1 UDP-N-acetylenolpyruvoylglucosamine reductase [Epulopiscium sp. SCG-B11WGA-EpuloA1]
MDNKQLIFNMLQNFLQEDQIKVNEPISKHTTFKIGGKASFWVTPQNFEQLSNIIKLCNNMEVDYYMFGNGSNLLAKDEGYEGIIIQIFNNLNKINLEGNTITSQAGILLSKVAKIAEQNSLSGFEFAYGIPGTLGGAVVMNAGAYDGEIKNVIKSAKVMDRQGNIFVLSKEELELGYRTSIISKKGYIVLEATLQLQNGNKEEIASKMKDFMQRRRDKQPLEYPSAGSTFKRPEGYFAGKLIMDSGLRGFSVGGAQVSQKHCGFVINVGEATYKDVIDLVTHVKTVVKDKYKIDLELEVKIIGS